MPDRTPPYLRAAPDLGFRRLWASVSWIFLICVITMLNFVSVVKFGLTFSSCP